MRLSTEWVGYVDRTFSSIKTSILTQLNTVMPELTDRSSSNLLIILVDIFASVGELLNYYIDTTARELFLPTARRFSSILKLANLVGYPGRARIASYITVKLIAYNSDGDITPLPSDFLIPSGTLFSDTNGNTWQSLSDFIFRKGYSEADLDLRQFEQISDYSLGYASGSADFSIELPTDYAEGSADILVDGEHWRRVEDLGFSLPSDKDFQVKMEADGKIYVRFGDGVHGKIPEANAPILLNYWSTAGVSANIPAGALTTLVSPLSLPSPISRLEVVNPYSGYGGKDIEGIEDLRKAIPLSLKTLYRAVSESDYVSLTTLAPGVRGALVSFDCGLGVTLFIVAEGGGNPTQTLLTDVENFIKDRAIVGLPISLQPSGETHIKGQITVKGRYRVVSSVIQRAVHKALLDLYNPYRVYIDQAIRTSDIIATVDNLPEVDYLTLDWFYAVPYLRPSNLQVLLDYNIEILPASNALVHWKLVYDGVHSKFNLYKEGNLRVAMEVDQEYEIDGLIKIKINGVPSGLSTNDFWTFNSYPYSRDVILEDHSIPIIGPNDFTLNIIETNG